MSHVEITKLVKTIPTNISQEEQRIAASVATGYFYNKSLKECISFYSLNPDTAIYWWNKFGFEKVDQTEKASKKKKAKSFIEFIDSNVGKIVSMKALSEELSISMPTAYKYVSDNRSAFKKVGHGKYEIVDTKKERVESKK